MKNLLPDSRRPDVTFRADGRIDISARVATILDLNDDTYINVTYERGEYYLTVSHRGHCIGDRIGRCHRVNRRAAFFRANSVLLCRAMLRTCGARRRVSLTCGEPVTLDGGLYIPMITLNPITHE